MSESLVKLWHYNNWANTILIENFQQDVPTILPSCLLLLSHIINAQIIWLDRMEDRRSTVGLWEEHSLDICSQYHADSSPVLLRKIETLSWKYPQLVQYHNMRGVLCTSTLADILLHVLNHGTYHRAQIAQLMQQAGIVAVNTDYIRYSRLEL